MATVVHPVVSQYDENGNLKYDTISPDGVPVQPVQLVQPVQPVQPVVPVQPVEPVQQTEPVQPVAPVETDETLRERELERERLDNREGRRVEVVEGKHDSIAERLVKKVTGKA